MQRRLMSGAKPNARQLVHQMPVGRAERVPIGRHALRARLERVVRAETASEYAQAKLQDPFRGAHERVDSFPSTVLRLEGQVERKQRLLARQIRRITKGALHAHTQLTQTRREVVLTARSCRTKERPAGVGSQTVP